MTSGRFKATHAHTLNQAISNLWQAEATHAKVDFQTTVVPIYTALLEKLKHHQSQESAEHTVIDLLNRSTVACHYRWTLRLPLKRPGCDYRKYEIIYTRALITVMAVDCLRANTNQRDVAPDALASTLLPPTLIRQLQQDPIVWTDWLGFFQRAEEGGLYAVSIQRLIQPIKQPRPKKQHSPSPQQPPAPGSGRAMLEAIKVALADGTLSYNQPGDAVQVDNEGRTFLEHPKILKWCKRQLALDDDLKKLKARFSRLKVNKRSTAGQQLFYGRHTQHGRRRIGYVWENPTILWPGSAPKGDFRIEQVTGHT